MSSIDLEAEYNNPRMVPDFAAIGARWVAQSEATRASVKGELDLAYGPGPRHRFDLFTTRQSRPRHAARRLPARRRVAARRPQGLQLRRPRAGRAGHRRRDPLLLAVPRATVAQIYDEVRTFLRVLWKHTGRRPAVVGHSVGGTMAAAMMATDWTRFGDVPDDLVRWVYSISGVFEVEPYVHTSYNVALQLTAEEARAVSPALWPAPPKNRVLVAAVGGAESQEFIRQSLDMAARWSAAGVKAEGVVIPGMNHFTIVDELARADSAMVNRVVRMAQSRGGGLSVVGRLDEYASASSSARMPRVLVGLGASSRFPLPDLTYCPMLERCAQPVMRFSTQAISTYMTMPSTASAISTANTSGMLNWLCAASIVWPRPELAPSVSDITAPMKASVTATFSEPKK